MKPKISKLTTAQLNRLIIRGKAEEAVKRKEAIERARVKVLAILKKESLTMADIAPSLVPGQSLPPRPPKYQHPGDPTLTWSGQGRSPKWFAELLREGFKAEDLLVSAYADGKRPRHTAKPKAPVKKAKAATKAKVLKGAAQPATKSKAKRKL